MQASYWPTTTVAARRVTGRAATKGTSLTEADRPLDRAASACSQTVSVTGGRFHQQYAPSVCSVHDKKNALLVNVSTDEG